MKSKYLSVLVGIGAIPVLAAGQAEPSKTASPDFWDPIPACSSTTPPSEIRDGYWRSQFERINQEVTQAQNSQLIFFGDSITMSWNLLQSNGKEVWNQRFAKYQPINMGNSGDITPVMLYRATHGNLAFPKDKAPRVAVLLCGINNYTVMKSDEGREKWALGIDTPPREVADGVRAVAQAFRKQLPTTRVILLGILPCKQPEKWTKVKETNRILASYRYPKDEVVFIDLAKYFTNSDGSLKSELYTDGTHLTEDGYKVMANVLEPEIERLMGLGSDK
jgi:lysophospholipase L1-like esterase